MFFIKFLAGLLIVTLAYYTLYEAYRWFRNTEIVQDFLSEKDLTEEDEQ